MSSVRMGRTLIAEAFGLPCGTRRPTLAGTAQFDPPEGDRINRKAQKKGKHQWSDSETEQQRPLIGQALPEVHLKSLLRSLMEKGEIYFSFSNLLKILDYYRLSPEDFFKELWNLLILNRNSYNRNEETLAGTTKSIFLLKIRWISAESSLKVLNYSSYQYFSGTKIASYFFKKFRIIEFPYIRFPSILCMRASIYAK